MEPATSESSLIWENRSKIMAMETEIKYISQNIASIKNNHLAHMQKSMEAMQEDISQLRQTDKQGEFLGSLGGQVIKTIMNALIVGGLVMLGLKLG